MPCPEGTHNLRGSALGIGIGVGFGWAMVKAMEETGIGELVIPTTQLGWIVVLAAVIAAALPACRASKLDVLKSIQHD